MFPCSFLSWKILLFIVTCTKANMHFTSLVSCCLGLSAALVAAAPAAPMDKRSFVQKNGVNYTVFEHAVTGAKLEFVKNSGICETTPGVNQYSGYLSVGTNMNMCRPLHSG